MSPRHPQSQGSKIQTQVSLLDIFPTILDWFDIKIPEYHIFKKRGNVQLTGNSLLSFLDSGKEKISRPVFMSQNLHEATMYYPMRSVRTERFSLIHNLNFWSPFPIDQDGYLSSTFQDILKKTKAGEKIPWNITLKEYYYRSEWELFDRKEDPFELTNVANKPRYSKIFHELSRELTSWQNITNDPWICAPHSVLEGDICMDLFNHL